MSALSRTRRGVQLGVLALLVAMPLAASAELPFASGTLCSLDLGVFSLACPVGAAQTGLATRSFDGGLWLSVLPWIVLAMVAGRVFCSWICPQGFSSELTDGLRTRWRSSLARVPDSKLRFLRGRRLLWGVFGVGMLGSFLLGIPLLCYICPIGILCRNLVSAGMFGTVGAEVMVLALIVAVEFTVARKGYCRYICPVGALYGACTQKRSLTVVRDVKACEGCRTCEQECPMGNSPVRNQVRTTCTNCRVCIDQCPEEALTLKLGSPPRPLR